MGAKTAEDDVALARWHHRALSRSLEAESPEYRRARREPAERPRTIVEAASELGLSVHTVRAWVAARRIAYIRLGRAIRIPATEIRRVIEDHTVPAIREQ
jgi:excisionase family DNA binding protein